MRALRLFIWFSVLTGIFYPLFITGVAQLTMNKKANGTLLKNNDQIIGSLLIGQNFENEKYFWSRPSAGSYHALPSGGSNLGPTSKELQKLVEKRKNRFSQSLIPSDLLFTSGSGLDPHISLEAALFQMDRIIKTRNIDKNKIQALINSSLEKSLGFGPPYVNVLKLNLNLDKLK